MKVYHNLQDFEPLDYAIVTVGTFDGVHVGHQQLLNRIHELAKKNNGESVLLTFHPHPRLVLFPEDNDLKLITTLEERIELLSKTGIDHLIIHPFSTEFSRTTAVEYVRDILVNRIGAKKLVIGYDHHFGRNREGSLENLKELAPTYGFEVEEIPAQEIKDVNVSSTKIRNALLEGQIQRASSFLGYDFCLHGVIKKGEGIGKNLGFPTANILTEDSHKIVPGKGVYATLIEVDGKTHLSMTNIGVRPTVHSDSSTTVECHILDFDQDIYGKKVNLQFVKRLRDESKFDSLQDLQEQLRLDSENAKDVLQASIN